MSVATGISRAEALETLLPEICPHLTPARRESQVRASGGGANRKIMYVYNTIARCLPHRGGRGVTVDMVGDQECCHRFSWEELLGACGDEPRQAGLL